MVQLQALKLYTLNDDILNYIYIMNSKTNQLLAVNDLLCMLNFGKARGTCRHS